MRTKLLTATAVLLASLTGAGTAWAHCGVMHDAPAGEKAVLHVSTGRTVFSPPGPEVTIRADGMAIINFNKDGVEPLIVEIGRAGVRQLLRDGRHAGLLEDVDFGEADITDQATTTIEIRDGQHHQHLSIYALVFGGAGYGPGDLGLTREQAAARAKLAEFVDRLDDPKTYESPRDATIDHPTGAQDVVLRTETSNNFWGGSYADAAAFTLYGDGRLVQGDGATRQLPEAEVQRLLADARRVGLLGHRSYGNALVTDQGTTTVEILACGVERPGRSAPHETPLAASTSGSCVDRTLHIYALELVEGDHGLPSAQRHARRALRAFLHGV
jgi:hypothetical protein